MLTRVAVKVAAFNLGVDLKISARPAFAFFDPFEEGHSHQTSFGQPLPQGLRGDPACALG